MGRTEVRGKQSNTLSREEVCRRLKDLLGQKDIQKFILFGSFARGTQTSDSDVDLIVVVETSERFLDRYDELLPFLHDALRPHAVSPLIYTPTELDRMRERPFGIVATACEEGIEIDV
jgi:predicted nucleotidyltransferase